MTSNSATAASCATTHTRAAHTACAATMSRWKNAAPRREHRERSQPHARAKLGLLEKKKDYKQRAVAYHRKQDRLQALRLRAAFRNPDEFSHKMIKSQTTVCVRVCLCVWLRCRIAGGARAPADTDCVRSLCCRAGGTVILRARNS